MVLHDDNYQHNVTKLRLVFHKLSARDLEAINDTLETMLCSPGNSYICLFPPSSSMEIRVVRPIRG